MFAGRKFIEIRKNNSVYGTTWAQKVGHSRHHDFLEQTTDKRDNACRYMPQFSFILCLEHFFIFFWRAYKHNVWQHHGVHCGGADLLRVPPGSKSGRPGPLRQQPPSLWGLLWQMGEELLPDLHRAVPDPETAVLSVGRKDPGQSCLPMHVCTFFFHPSICRKECSNPSVPFNVQVQRGRVRPLLQEVWAAAAREGLRVPPCGGGGQQSGRRSLQRERLLRGLPRAPSGDAGDGRRDGQGLPGDLSRNGEQSLIHRKCFHVQIENLFYCSTVNIFLWWIKVHCLL